MTKIIAIFFLLFLLFPPAAYSDLLETVSSKLICQCGCTIILSDCQCQTAQEMRDKVRLMIDQGKGEKQIIASFVSLYGEKVLGEPPKRGFNLLAYILPLAAILTGGIFIWWLIRRWTILSHKKEEARRMEKVDKKYQEKVRRELNKYDF